MSIKINCLLLLPFLLVACAKKDVLLEPENPDSKYLTYLALGDSYTIGQSVQETERFPAQLSLQLSQAGFDMGHVRILAKTGWTTDELKAGISNSNLTADSSFSLVSLLIGVNNQYRGRPVSAYKPEFEALLNQAIGFAGGRKERVFVVSIPDYAFTPFGQGDATISLGIDEFNAANREITEAAGVQYFDITPISREGLNDPSMVADDGLHPSGKQYSKWVSTMLADVKAMLK